MQPQFAELLEEPDTLPELPLLDEALLDDDEHREAGARTKVRRNMERLGIPPFSLWPWAKNPLPPRTMTHEPSAGPHSSPGAGELPTGSMLT